MCYLGAALHALAACPLVAAWLRVVRAGGGGGGGGGAGLVGDLAAALEALAPRARPPARPVSAAGVAHALRCATGGGAFAAGREHDAAEALEALVALTAAQGRAAFRGAALPRLLGRDAARCLRADGSGAPRPAGAALAAWRLAAPPLEGLLATESVCLRCRRRGEARLDPFLALPVTLPLAPGGALPGVRRVADGADLGSCLRAGYSRFELVEGTACSGCAARATAARRTVVARWPLVLVLLLKRAAWTAAGETKVVGRLPFPEVLSTAGLPGFGGAEGGGGGSVYRLLCVVVHGGWASGTGHYLVFRRAGAAAWARASDEAVRPAARAEVLGAEATLLVYERAAAAAAGREGVG